MKHANEVQNFGGKNITVMSISIIHHLPLQSIIVTIYSVRLLPLPPSQPLSKCCHTVRDIGGLPLTWMCLGVLKYIRVCVYTHTHTCVFKHTQNMYMCMHVYYYELIVNCFLQPWLSMIASYLIICPSRITAYNT